MPAVYNFAYAFTAQPMPTAALALRCRNLGPLPPRPFHPAIGRHSPAGRSADTAAGSQLRRRNGSRFHRLCHRGPQPVGRTRVSGTRGPAVSLVAAAVSPAVVRPRLVGVGSRGLCRFSERRSFRIDHFPGWTLAAGAAQFPIPDPVGNCRRYAVGSLGASGRYGSIRTDIHSLCPAGLAPDRAVPARREGLGLVSSRLVHRPGLFGPLHRRNPDNHHGPAPAFPARHSVEQSLAYGCLFPDCLYPHRTLAAAELSA